MTANRKNRASVRRAIESSCVPLLCGSEKQIFFTARILFRAYGITSYGLTPRGSHRMGFFKRLSTAALVRMIPTSVHTPALLAESALRFFEGIDHTTALPVFIDCTEERVFLRDKVLRELLEPHAFLSDPEHLSEIPPFCYYHLGGEACDN